MTHDELLAAIHFNKQTLESSDKNSNALRAVVEVVQGYERFAKNRPAESDTEKSFDNGMSTVSRMVIQAIEKELK